MKCFEKQIPTESTLLIYWPLAMIFWSRSIHVVRVITNPSAQSSSFLRRAPSTGRGNVSIGGAEFAVDLQVSSFAPC